MPMYDGPLQICPRRGWIETDVPFTRTGVDPDEEQLLLTLVRDSRVPDTFTRRTCYSLLSPWRTDVPGLGRVETAEIYLGAKGKDVSEPVPIQANAAGEAFDLAKIGQDLALCRYKFPALIPRPIGARFMDRNQIALFQFAERAGGLALIAEAHYRLVPSDQLSAQELEAYRLAAR